MIDTWEENEKELIFGYDLCDDLYATVNQEIVPSSVWKSKAISVISFSCFECISKLIATLASEMQQ